MNKNVSTLYTVSFYVKIYYCRSFSGSEEIEAGVIQASLGRYLVHHAGDHGTDGRRHRQNLNTANYSEDCPLTLPIVV